MWSFFSRDPAKGFPYEVGEKVSGLESDNSIWSLHEGKQKVSTVVNSFLTFILIIYLFLFLFCLVQNAMLSSFKNNVLDLNLPQTTLKLKAISISACPDHPRKTNIFHPMWHHQC